MLSLLQGPLRIVRRLLAVARGLVGRLLSTRFILPLVNLYAGEETLPPPPPPPGPKTLLLVRHGQSMHNISSVNEYGDAGTDATLFDAKLSPLGEKQVAALAGNELLGKAELAICSPLTRAVQTLFGAFPVAAGPPPMPVELWPLVAEHLTDSCDIGSGASALSRAFPTLSMASLPEVWWYTDEESLRTNAEASRSKYREVGFMEPERLLVERVDAFVAQVRQRPERVIAVFGHSDYFNFLMERFSGVRGYWLENAEVYQMELPQEVAPIGEEIRA